MIRATRRSTLRLAVGATGLTLAPVGTAAGDKRTTVPDFDQLTTRHRTVQVGELEIFYREAGPKDAPAILLLHGFPTSSHMFRHGAVRATAP